MSSRLESFAGTRIFTYCYNTNMPFQKQSKPDQPAMVTRHQNIVWNAKTIKMFKTSLFYLLTRARSTVCYLQIHFDVSVVPPHHVLKCKIPVHAVLMYDECLPWTYLVSVYCSAKRAPTYGMKDCITHTVQITFHHCPHWHRRLKSTTNFPASNCASFDKHRFPSPIIFAMVCVAKKTLPP